MIDDIKNSHKPTKVIRVETGSVAQVMVTRDWYTLAMVSSSSMLNARRAAADSLRETAARLTRENDEMIADVQRAIATLENALEEVAG